MLRGRVSPAFWALAAVHPKSLSLWATICPPRHYLGASYGWEFSGLSLVEPFLAFSAAVFSRCCCLFPSLCAAASGLGGLDVVTIIAGKSSGIVELCLAPPGQQCNLLNLFAAFPPGTDGPAVDGVALELEQASSQGEARDPEMGSLHFPPPFRKQLYSS